MASKFEPEKYYDTFEENLKKLIKARIEGGDVTEVEKPKKLAPVVDLMSALKESLAQMEGKKKPAERVREAQRESEVRAVSAGEGGGTDRKSVV